MLFPLSQGKRRYSLFGFRSMLLIFTAVPAFASTGATPEPPIHPLWILPFGLLLLAIATLPLLAKHFWEKFYGWIAGGFGAVVVGYYLFGLQYTDRLIGTAHEYISFICLIGSLFIVTGGILIHLWKPGRPILNVVLLGIGAVIANLFGTTGASALLIRPFIRVNRGRLKPYHIVFFIFIVSNTGGLLTPIGDPPLFLGYLKGVPFFWLFEHVIWIWLLAVGLLLGIFYLIDARNKGVVPVATPPTGHKSFELLGKHNFWYLAVIILAVLFNHELNQVMLFLPELIQVIAALLSLKTTPKVVHVHNEFSFGPIKEVALLFLGIFATMIPALQYLETNASQLGINTPGMFYWCSGSLSSVLDNAPTYLTFLSAAIGLHGMEVNGLLQQSSTYIYIIAISVGSVFFGANTYIGNGPNFMVKSIAEELGCATPSFFGYIVKYSIPILLPVFALVWWIWFV